MAYLEQLEALRQPVDQPRLVDPSVVDPEPACMLSSGAGRSS